MVNRELKEMQAIIKEVKFVLFWECLQAIAYSVCSGTTHLFSYVPYVLTEIYFCSSCMLCVGTEQDND